MALLRHIIRRQNTIPGFVHRGDAFEEYTRSSGNDRTPSEHEQREEYRFAKGDLRNFDPGEAVICRQGKGWVHGRIQLLEE